MSQEKKESRRYSDARESIKKTIRKKEHLTHIPSEPDLALDLVGAETDRETSVGLALSAEHLFRKTIEDSLPCGVAGIDLNGYQVYTNPFFSKIVGWSQEELIGKKFPFDYCTSDSIRSFQKIMKGEVPADGLEVLFKRKDDGQFWGIIFSSAFFDSYGETVGYIYTLTDINRNKELERSLKSVSAKLISARETERRFIARDLHDSIGGKLTGIKYSLENLSSDFIENPKTSETAIDDIIQQVKATIEDTQRITKSLHPSIIEDLGIISGIHEFCREYQALYQKIHMTVKIGVNEEEIPENIKILIYRVMQESLNNVAKHSNARNVTVFLQLEDHHVQLLVKDDGQGFDNSPRGRGGMGINNMRENAVLFGGSFHIDSSRGKGTVVKAGWPANP